MNLRVVRIKNGMTQKELSKRSGVSRNLISKAENGNFLSISYGKMEKISQILGLSAKELFFDE